MHALSEVEPKFYFQHSRTATSDAPRAKLSGLADRRGRKSQTKDDKKDRIKDLPPILLDLKMDEQGTPSTLAAGLQGKGAACEVSNAAN